MTHAWSHREVVPYWLVAAVLVLLLGVLGLGAWVLNTTVFAADEAQLTEVDRRLQAVAEAPTDLSARVQLGYAYQCEGDFALAVDTYDGVLAIDADNLAALYNRAAALVAVGESAKAEADYRRVLELAPRHALAAYGLSRLFAADDRFAEIIPVLRPAAEANPNLADLQAYLGLAYEKEGQAAAATEYYEKTLQLDPEFEIAKEGLARVKGVAK